MKIEFRTSKDGSHTLFLPDLNETYHSLHGAIQESEYVFIEKGLAEVSKAKSTITILEVGFGTGLNALLSLLYSIHSSKKIIYHTLEPFPLPKEIYEGLNYIELLQAQKYADDFLKMHASENAVVLDLQSSMKFSRYISTLESFSPENLSADLIFYDAFAPSKQPEVWSLENLKKIKGLISPDGLLVTYCAHGQFKRDLKEAGFAVETLQGPPGKKEMTRAFPIGIDSVNNHP